MKNNNVKKFDVLLEDGGLIKDCMIFTTRGIARDERDVFNAIYFDKQIIVNNKYCNNYKIKANDIYSVWNSCKENINKKTALS